MGASVHLGTQGSTQGVSLVLEGSGATFTGAGQPGGGAGGNGSCSEHGGQGSSVQGASAEVLSVNSIHSSKAG